MTRLLFEKLVFTGPGLEPAVIKFEPGLNVISGPSDTGKSLIFECINYVLGGSTRPKEPPEAKGYTNLFLSCVAANKQFTVERSVLSNDVRIFEVAFDRINVSTASQVISANANANPNLSEYLLTIVGISNKRLKKNERNETQNLTFNILKNLLMVDELRIQSSTSPILSGVPIFATAEKALFRFLLTGIDYANVIPDVKPEIRKADANARITLLNQLISDHKAKIIIESSEADLFSQLQRLENTIQAEIEKVSTYQDEIEVLKNSRKKAWDEYIQAESKIDQLNELSSRFTLLNKYYDSDLNRLDAIIETGDALAQITDAHCPVCGADKAHHRPDCVISQDEINSVNASCENEKAKILSLKTDLENTILQLNNDLQALVSTMQASKISFEAIDNELSKKLEPATVKSKNLIAEYYGQKANIESSIKTVSQINLMTQLKMQAEGDLKPQPRKEKTQVGLQTSEANDFVRLIEAALQSWGYPGLGTISFSEDNQDITIGQKNRGDQGKGFRAITHAAFIISLMEYCVNLNLPHPGFVVLDSPLVTYRGADNSLTSADEGISVDMKDKFYTALSDLKPDRQLIVIENDDPPTNIASKINYIHFTKELGNGRFGFIPIKGNTKK